MRPFIIDLFDGEDNPGAGDGNDDPQDNQDGEHSQSDTKTRNQRSSNREPNQRGASRERDVETELRLRDIQEDLNKSNSEAAQRRRENKALRESVERLQSESNAVKNRAIRTEARAALAERGVIHKDVIDVFLRTAGDKIKIDDSFEVQGLDTALEAFATSHSVFFKQQAQAASDDNAGGGGKAGDTENKGDGEGGKSNKTSTGGSPKGGGGAGDKGSYVRDPNDKRSATDLLKDYKRSIFSRA